MNRWTALVIYNNGDLVKASAGGNDSTGWIGWVTYWPRPDRPMELLHTSPEPEHRYKTKGEAVAAAQDVIDKIRAFTLDELMAPNPDELALSGQETPHA